MSVKQKLGGYAVLLGELLFLAVTGCLITVMM
jgi:hypothetical protein